MKNGNSMMFLNLYKTENTWQFDDDKFEIVAEPFILGMSEMISSYLTVNTINCTAIFSLSKFPECETLKLLNGEMVTAGCHGWDSFFACSCPTGAGEEVVKLSHPWQPVATISTLTVYHLTVNRSNRLTILPFSHFTTTTCMHVEEING